MEILKIILYLVGFVLGVMVWLLSGVISFEFVEWLDRKSKEKKNDK